MVDYPIMSGMKTLNYQVYNGMRWFEEGNMMMGVESEYFDFDGQNLHQTTQSIDETLVFKYNQYDNEEEGDSANNLLSESYN